ncbi:TrmH family RNA methyltransferase [Aurantimonas marina]|uniref:TrmH family RNA methyltransferase n=1 Tax=Aurantimonas marina TaxID=2780508 RepID=UPI002FCD98AD
MPETIAIDDPADPRIAVFRDIRDRDLTGRGGFIAEGTVVLDQLLSSRQFRPTALLVLRNRLAGLSDLLSRVPRGVPIHVAEREVLDRIAGFPMHRGVLAHGEEEGVRSTPAELAASAAALGRPVVVAVGIANHDNVGAIFRNAAAFGAGAVLLDTTSCHPLYRKAIRVSVGTVLTIPWSRVGAGTDLVSLCRDAGYRTIALSPAEGITLREFVSDGPMALFLGAEGRGLSAELMERMETVRIEMEPDVDSLNVATAAAIVLSGLYGNRQR